MKAPVPRRITRALLRKWPLPDPSDSESKEDRGRVLIVGGSVETPGAVRLAGEAALRAGAGKLQIACPLQVAVPVALAMPEAKVVGLRADRRGQIATCSSEVLDSARKADALLVGPGMSDGVSPRRTAAQLAKANERTVILDAGALRSFGRHRVAAVILTPHFGEMASITGLDVERIRRDSIAVARDFARAHAVTVVLKGPRTCIASRDGRVWLYEGGSVGLGTSGSGDVLAGVIAGLAARGASAEQAAAWGVWLHGEAGSVLSGRLGPVGFLAGEIAREIPTLLQTTARR
jgi:hydroxyethylthiazole kinase-like uncharacterized protein yjeF